VNNVADLGDFCPDLNPFYLKVRARILAKINFLANFFLDFLLNYVLKSLFMNKVKQRMEFYSIYCS
jgi:hypothetical protein